MPRVGFGGPNSSGAFSAGTLYSDGIGLPSGRAMANGSTACLITELYMYVRGNGANPVGRIRLGSAVTDPVTAPAHSDSTPGIGYFGTNGWLVNGGTARAQWEGPASGPVFFGRGGGGTVFGPGSYSRSGTLGGAYGYAEAPSAPRSLALSDATPDSLRATFISPADNGGSTVTGYQLEWADNPTFVGASKQAITSGSVLLTGLRPGTRYYVRVAAKNGVTAAAGTVGPYTSAASADTLSGAAVSDGATYKDTALYVSDGVGYPAAQVLYCNGTAYIPAG